MTDDQMKQLTEDDQLRDGNVVIEERMNRRDGLVEYRGTADAEEFSDPAEATPSDQPAEER